jgi:hypothetical protein
LLAHERWPAILDSGLVFDGARTGLYRLENAKGLSPNFVKDLDCGQWDPDTAILEHDNFCNDNFLNDPPVAPAGEVAELS